MIGLAHIGHLIRETEVKKKQKLTSPSEDVSKALRSLLYFPNNLQAACYGSRNSLCVSHCVIMRKCTFAERIDEQNVA